MRFEVSLMKKTLLTIAIAIGVGALVGMVWIIFRPRPDPQLVKIAKKHDIDLEDLTFHTKVLRKVSRGEKVSSEEWEMIGKFIREGNHAFRAGNAGLLSYAKGSSYESEAIDLSNNLLEDPDPSIAAIAMINLYRLDAPNWKQVVEDNLDSEHLSLRNTAGLIKMGKVERREVE